MLFIALSFAGEASHNRSGEILYKRIAPYSNVSGPVYTYSITIIKYTDTGVGIADRCVDTIFPGDGTKLVAPRINGLTSCSCGSLNSTAIGCGEIIFSVQGYQVKKNIYSIVHTYSVSGTYLIRSSDLYRTSGSSSIPNSGTVDFYIESKIVIDPLQSYEMNSSPVLSNPPVDMGIVGACYYHNPCAYDADGDSLSFETGPCLRFSGPITGYSYPGPGSFSIDGVTGLLTWCSPQSQGEFNVVILVKEWRKKTCTGIYEMIGYVSRDLQILIGTGTTFTLSAPSLTDGCVVAGSNFSKTFSANTPSNVTVSVYGSASTGQSPASITPSTGLASGTFTFSWLPPCDMAQQKSNRVHLVYSQPGTTSNLRLYRQFNVNVMPPSPNVFSVTKDTGKVLLKWHQPPGCGGNLVGYNIYRKAGSNTWSPVPCQYGVPSVSGFSLIGNVTPADSSFTDNNLSGLFNGSTCNYLVTSVMNNCVESPPDNVHTLNLIVGIRQFPVNGSDSRIYPIPCGDELTVELTNAAAAGNQIILFAVDGKEIFKSGTLESSTLTIPMGHLKPGLYLLMIKTRDGQSFRKIVKE